MGNELVDIWRQAHRDFREAAVMAPWHHGTLLPSWTVADLVAHTVWIERTAAGLQDPPHEPDWPRLPPVTSEFGRLSEIPVDLRRTRPRDEVLAELDSIVADRYAALLRTASDATAPDIFGAPRPLSRVLRDRILDLWVHEQDIRVAVASPGHLDTAAARVAADVLIAALGFVWAKRAAAPIGSSLVVATTGPGLEFRTAVERMGDGRARPVPPPSDPTVRLTMSFGNFIALTCGRSNADASAVTVDGDPGLAQAVLGQFAVTP